MSIAQDREMAEIRHALELLSHAAVQAWNASGGHGGEPDDRFVAHVARRDDPLFVRVYAQARTDWDRSQVISDARAELKALSTPRDWQKLKDAPSISFDKIILDDGVGWTPEIVSLTYRITQTQVRKIRAAAGMSTEDGRPLLPTSDGPQPTSRAEWAQSMRDQGLSQEEIAQRMGVSQPTVHRLLKTRLLRRAAS